MGIPLIAQVSTKWVAEAGRARPSIVLQRAEAGGPQGCPMMHTPRISTSTYPVSGPDGRCHMNRTALPVNVALAPVGSAKDTCPRPGRRLGQVASTVGDVEPRRSACRAGRRASRGRHYGTRHRPSVPSRLSRSRGRPHDVQRPRPHPSTSMAVCRSHRGANQHRTRRRCLCAAIARLGGIGSSGVGLRDPADSRLRGRHGQPAPPLDQVRIARGRGRPPGLTGPSSCVSGT